MLSPKQLAILKSQERFSGTLVAFDTILSMLTILSDSRRRRRWHRCSLWTRPPSLRHLLWSTLGHNTLASRYVTFSYTLYLIKCGLLNILFFPATTQIYLHWALKHVPGLSLTYFYIYFIKQYFETVLAHIRAGF